MMQLLQRHKRLIEGELFPPGSLMEKYHGLPFKSLSSWNSQSPDQATAAQKVGGRFIPCCQR